MRESRRGYLMDGISWLSVSLLSFGSVILSFYSYTLDVGHRQEDIDRGCQLAEKGLAGREQNEAGVGVSSIVKLRGAAMSHPSPRTSNVSTPLPPLPRPMLLKK